MKHYITHFAALLLVGFTLCLATSCGNDDDEVTPSTEQNDDNGAGKQGEDSGEVNPNDYVTTGRATDITLWSATLTCIINETLSNTDRLKCTYGIVIGTDRNKLKDTGTYTQANNGVTGNSYTVTAKVQPNTTYYYCAYVQMEGGTKFYSSLIKSFTTDDYSFPQGAVDLGLSVKWASCNLGASAPEEYGDYYGWGCTEPYKADENVGWKLYSKYIGGSITQYDDCGTAKDPLQAYVYPNNKSIAGTKWDAARVKLGDSWRMPTSEEQQELLNNCTWTWTTKNGVNGYCVTSKTNGNSIFLPAAGYRYGTSLGRASSNGYYWGAAPGAYDVIRACSLYFSASSQGWSNDVSRYDGHAVRPVSE